MTLFQLIILQFIAHILADFIFQTDKKAIEKNQNGFKSGFLKSHALIVFSLSWVMSFQINFVFAALTIAFSHWLLDGLKKYLNDHQKFGRYAFFIDQSMHLSVDLIIIYTFIKYFDINPLIRICLDGKKLAMIAGFLICSKPANIFIKEILRAFEIKYESKEDTKNQELQNAGKLIGIIERWLVLILVLLNQFAAVGFLIAAKSILRYQDHETIKTEYVLIGTMLSFGIAIATAVSINLIKS